ncbi:MAG TPA: sulfite exporter TauE/SafE family protein [Thermoanaerobaculia bacterium]|nr:sulfite exporter TauE/SafE family protein [Thermoanaerobaculia bacterium]
MPDPVTLAALLASAAGAGVMNAMAGGGTILTFPTLIFLGEPAITANATSTVALWPGSAASLYGFRREVQGHRDWLRRLFLPSLLGGALGAALLLQTPAKSFERLAPFLVLFATLLFSVQGAVSRWSAAHHEDGRAPGRRVAAWVFQFGVAVYGGYFGAGIGILMLAVLGFLGLADIHAANGLKNIFAMCINGVAAAYFIARGAVDWPAALILMVGAIAGGYAGARLARRIGREKARSAVVVIGLAVAILLFLQRNRL